MFRNLTYFYTKQFWKKLITVVLALVTVVGYGWIVFAAAPAGGYTPGERINPDCAPGESNCFVRQAWSINAADGKVFNTTDAITIGGDSGTLPLTVIGGMQNENTTADGFSLISTDTELFGQPGIFMASAGTGFTPANFFDDDYTGLTGALARFDTVGGIAELVQRNYSAGVETIQGVLRLDPDGANVSYRKLRPSGDPHDPDSETIVGGFLTDTLSPGVYRAAMGASVYDYNTADATPHVMQYGYSAYTQHADHFVFDVDLGIDTRAYTVEDAGTREEILYNISSTTNYDMSGRVVTDAENTMYFGKHVDSGSSTQDNSLSMDSDGLNYRTDGGRLLFEDYPASLNTSHTASLDYNGSGPTVQQKMYFDFDKQAFRLGSVASIKWDAGSSVGVGSIAMGFAENSGDNDTSTASGDYSVAIGQANITSGKRSFAIGTALHAAGDDEMVVGAYNVQYLPSGTDSDRQFTVATGTKGNEHNALTVLKNGDVGIGFDYFEYASNGNTFQIGDGTSVIAYVDDITGNWVSVSDERKKQNIQDLDYGLDQLLQLRPVSFNYIRNNEHTIGFLAQQVLPIIPESVFGSESEGYGMSYQTLTPVIVKAIQELNLKIKSVSELINMDKISARQLQATEKLCINSTCVTEEQLQYLLNNSRHEGGMPAPTPDPAPENDTPTNDQGEVTSDDTTSTPTDILPEATDGTGKITDTPAPTAE
jgi:hypothetical protein